MAPSSPSKSPFPPSERATSTSPTKLAIEDTGLATSSNDPAAAELSQAVEDMLNNITSKFANVSGELLAKMDDMAKRLDTLEATIQAGASSSGKREGE